MRKILLKIFDIEDNEFVQVMLLLAMGFAIGVFLATYDVATMTLFVGNLNENTDLPLAVMATGGVGIVFTYLFSFLQSKISYSRLSVAVLLIILCSLIAIRVGYGEITPETMKNKKELIFLSLVLMGPFDALLLLIFWGSIARMFVLKQQKRIVGGVDVGKGVATLIAFLTIPIISNFLPNTADLTYISISALAVIIGIYLAIIAKSPLLAKGKQKRVRMRGESVAKLTSFGFLSMLKNKYIVAMMLFVMCAMVGSKFVDYTFVNVMGQQYPDEKDLQNFIAVFQGITLVFALIIQVFVSDWLVETYGLRVTLLINPILLIVFTILCAVIGSFMGFEPASSGFILFFLAVALSKMFASSLKDAIDDAVFKFFYFPIDATIRLDVMARMDGLIKVGSGLIAGLILTGIQVLHFSSLLLFTFALIPIIIAWVFSTNKMYEKYRITLQETLISTKNKAVKNVNSEFSIDRMLLGEIKSDNPEKVIFALKLMEKLEPTLFEEKMVALANNADFPTVQDYAMAKIEALNITQEGVTSFKVMSDEQVRTKVKSRNINDRLEIAKIFHAVSNPKNEYLLIELLRDIDFKVRLYAIHAARKIKKPESWTILIDALPSALLGNAAAAALIAMGDGVLPFLEASFQKTGQNEQIMSRIVQIYGRIGTPKAISLLWGKLSYPDQEVIEQALFAFSYNNIKVPEDKHTLINHIIEVEIGDAAWDIAALSEIKDARYNEYLIKSLKDEVAYNFESIFTLLSLIYDYQSIQLVKDCLESDQADGKMFAIELLDMFLADELKPKLFPILEDIKNEEKVEKLQIYFPREKFNSVDVLKHLISRDYTFTNRWTRATAIYSLGNTADLIGLEELKANLFHPDPLLYETSAWAICVHDRPQYEAMKDRLPKKTMLEIDEVMKKALGNTVEIMPLRIQKTMFLKEIDFFQNIPSDIVSEIVELIQVRKIARDAIVLHKGQNADSPIYVVVSGRLASFGDNDKIIKTYEQREILGEKLVSDDDFYDRNIFATEPTILFEIDKNQFFEMLTHNHEFARGFIDAVGQHFEDTMVEVKRV